MLLSRVLPFVVCSPGGGGGAAGLSGSWEHGRECRPRSGRGSYSLCGCCILGDVQVSFEAQAAIRLLCYISGDVMTLVLLQER